MRSISTRLGTLGLAAGLAMAWSGTAMADRRAALSGNQLIEDSEDVFLFPSQALNYNKRLEVEVGSSANAGRALFLGGWDDLVLGFSAQAGGLPGLFLGPLPGDLMQRESAALWAPNSLPAGGTPAPFGSLAFPGGDTPFAMIDGFLAVPMDDMKFGLRATVGTSGSSQTVMDSDAGDSQFLLGLTGSLSGGTADETRWDASLNVAANFLSVAAGGAGDQSGTNLRFSGSTRLFIPYNDWLDIGVLGNLAFTTRSVTTGMGASEVTSSRMGLGAIAGAGPVYRLQDGSTLAVYGLAGFAMSSVDPNTNTDDNSTSNLVFFLPAVRAAAEIAVTDWFFARAGLQYSFQFGSASIDAGPPDSAAVRGGQLGWSAGMGVKADRFRIDGALQQAWLTEGPDFIGGESPLFGVLSVAYLW